MTDQEKFLKLYNGFGIVPQKNPEDTTFVIEAKQCDRVEGYNGFVVYHTFDNNGKFLNMGIWE